MRTVLAAFAVAVISVSTGCGGGRDPAPAEVTGTLHTQIKGVNYRTPSHSGQTDANGMFTGLAGETVTFSIGGIELGSAVMSSKISLFTLAGMTPPTSELALRRELWRMQSTATPLSRAANLASLILALDADGNPANGIDVSTHVNALASAQLDFKVSFIQFSAKLARLAPDLNQNISTATSVKWLYRTLGIAVAGSKPVRQTDDYDGDGVIDADLTSTEDAQGEIESLSIDLSADGQPDQLVYFTRDSLGRITHRRQLEAQLEYNIDTTFDVHGNEKRIVELEDGGADGSVDSETITESDFDRFGRILNSTRTIDFDFDGQPDSIERRVFTRDSRGNLLEQRVEVDLDADGGINGKYVTTSTYDAADRVATALYERDLDGDGEPESRIAQAWTYDAAGRQDTATEDYDNDGDGVVEQTRRATNTYDAAGNLQRVVSRYDTDLVGGFTYEVTSEFSYDRDQRVENSTQDYDFGADGTVESRITEVNTRDANGFPLSWENRTDNTADGVADSTILVTYTNSPEGAQQSFIAGFDHDADGVVDDRQTSQITYQPAVNALTPIVSQHLGY